MRTVVAGIQARMNSSRLEGKVLLPLGDGVLLEHILRAAARVKEIDHVVVLTGSLENNRELIQFCEERNILYRLGDEKNVLSRYEELRAATKADVLVRLTGDNPLVSSSLIRRVVSTICEDNSIEYCSNCVYQDYPLGLNVEAFTAAALEYALDAPDSAEEEHVTLRFKRRNDRTRDRHLPATAAEHWPGLRLTVDEIADYRFLVMLHRQLGETLWDIPRLLDFLRANQQLITNSSVKQVLA